MLCFLFLVSVKFVGVDLGSQFYKWAESFNNGEVRIHRDEVSNSVAHPSAAAVRLNVPHEPPFSPRDLEDIDIRFGRRAVAALKGNSSLGFEFLPRAVSRERGEFYTGTVTNASELFILMLQDAFMKVVPFEALSIAVPSYYTRDQMAEITEACRIFQLPLIAVVDDVSAVTTLYATQRTGRFIKADKHVLFVDVGATATKVYSAVFKYSKSEMGQLALVNMTSNQWSEKTGGYFFAQAIAKAKGVSWRKGQKMLIRNNGEGFDELLGSQLDDFEALLEAAVKSATQIRPIDEVQLIGGASALTFVVDTVRRVTNHTIRRDFNANEAIAMGAVVRAMLNEDESPYIQTLVMKSPPISMRVKFGNESKEYCTKSDSCASTIEFEDIDELPSLVEVVREEDSLVEGGKVVDCAYSFVNATNITAGEKMTVKFFMAHPSPIVDSAEICQGEKCQHVQVQNQNQPPPGYFESVDFIKGYLGSRKNTETREAIRSLLDRLLNIKQKCEKSNVEAPYEFTEDMKTVLTELSEQNDSHRFENFNSEELKEVMQKLEKIKEKLHLEN